MKALAWALLIASPVPLRVGPVVGVVAAVLTATAGLVILRRQRPTDRVGMIRQMSTASVVTAPWAAKFWPWLDARREVDRRRGRFHLRVPAVAAAALGGGWPMFVATGFYGALNYGSVVPGVLERCWAAAAIAVAGVVAARALAARFVPVMPRLARVILRVAVVALATGAILITTEAGSRAGRTLRRPGADSAQAGRVVAMLVPSTGRPLRATPAPVEEIRGLFATDEEARATFEEMSFLLSHDLWLVHTHGSGSNVVLWALFDRTDAQAVTVSPLLLREAAKS